jgi:hypothetical protein
LKEGAPAGAGVLKNLMLRVKNKTLVTRASAGYSTRTGSRVPPSLKRGLLHKRFTLILISEEV